MNRAHSAGPGIGTVLIDPEVGGDGIDDHMIGNDTIRRH